MTYTLGAITDLGTVQKEDFTKDAQLFQQAIPASDSDDAIIIDLFGVIRNISLSGVYTTANGTISTFIGLLDGLVNGTQSKIVFHSDKSEQDYNVIVNRVNWNSEEGEVNKVNWSIDLIETS